MTRMGRPEFLSLPTALMACGPFASFAQFAAKPSQKSKKPGDIRPGLGEILMEGLAVELFLPARHDQRGDAVADHVDRRAEHAHETVDSEN